MAEKNPSTESHLVPMGPLAPAQRWSLARKREVALRLLRGEPLGVSRQSVNELIRERRAVSPEMAHRLARLFGNSPELWLNMQRSVDLVGRTGCDR
jgi:plasmid maintenance system antidote protein VapI